MDSALLNLISTVFFVFAFAIGIAIIALRAIVRRVASWLSFLPDKLEGFLGDIWREWILPAAPIIVGGLAAYLIADYPYPAPFNESVSARTLFGIIAGFFSGSVYRFAKYHLKKYLPEEMKKKLDEVGQKLKISVPPPPPEE